MELTSTENSAAAIWQRTIQQAGSLAPAAARAFLQLKLSAADRKRVNDLAAKARAGDLSAEEEHELEHYRAIGTLIELLKSKARLSLRRK